MRWQRYIFISYCRTDIQKISIFVVWNIIVGRFMRKLKKMEDFKPNILDYFFYGTYGMVTRSSFFYDGENVNNRKSDSVLAIFWLSTYAIVYIFFIKMLIEIILFGAFKNQSTVSPFVFVVVVGLIAFILSYFYYIYDGKYNTVIEYFNNAEKSIRVRSIVSLFVYMGLPVVISIVWLFIAYL